MENFVFYNPTRLVFGKDSISRLSFHIPEGKRLMLVFGGGSVKQNGVYDQVIEALEGFYCVEFWGIEPNPSNTTLNKAIALARENKIDYLLAVGGGSVVDGTKYIAAGIPYTGNAWDLVLNPALITQAVPFASVITLPATGSEMNHAAVISNPQTNEKYPFASECIFPQFSVSDPQLTYSLPRYQLACGLADTYAHALEVYLNKVNVSPLMDRWAEGIFQTLLEISPKVLADQKDYETMASFMLTATMAVNGFIGMGVPRDFASHRIGHELTALCGITHGHTLAIIFPSTMQVMKEEKRAKILQYADRVFAIKEGSEEERIQAAIKSTRSYFIHLGLESRLSELGVDKNICDQIVQRFTDRGTILGENKTVTPQVVSDILKEAL